MYISSTKKSFQLFFVISYLSVLLIKSKDFLWISYVTMCILLMCYNYILMPKPSFNFVSGMNHIHVL